MGWEALMKSVARWCDSDSSHVNIYVLCDRSKGQLKEMFKNTSKDRFLFVMIRNASENKNCVAYVQENWVERLVFLVAGHY